MLVVLPHTVNQNTEEEGTLQLNQLIEFACAEFAKFEASHKRTMSEIKLGRFTTIMVNGERYDIKPSRPCALWFQCCSGSGYESGIFYVSEVTHHQTDRPFQLRFELVKDCDDEVVRVTTKALGTGRRSARGFMGPPVRD